VLIESEGLYVGAIPFAVKQKLGLSYIYQPFLVQQLGYYGDNVFLKDAWHFFYNHVLKYKLHADYTLKAADKNLAVSLLKPNSFEERINQTIDLSRNYASIYEHYRRDRKRDLKKLEGSYLMAEHDPKMAYQALKETGYLQEKFLSVEYKESLKHLLERYVSTETQNFFYLIKTANDDQKLACGFFPLHQDTVYNFIIARYKSDLERFVYAALLDRIIRKYAETLKTFDLEGSNIPGVQDFFSSMGAVKHTYYYYKKRIWK
jgi:hypothetical protein